MADEVKYKHSDTVHNLNSSGKIVPLFVEMFQPSSVLDVGCGIGTWLKSFMDSGIEDIVGIDGDYVNRHQLSEYIHPDKFTPKDLSVPFDLQRKFDLVISLEVAEHLPESSAARFVESLTKHGDTIIFSAAIPNQGGQNHLNEQWKKYWIDLFAQHGYKVFDLVRPRIWEIPEVEYWYKQNMLIFSKNDLSHLNTVDNVIHETIHPGLFAAKIEWYSNYIDDLYKQISELEKKRINE